MEDYISLLNEANQALGIVNNDGSPVEITSETINIVNGLPEAQQKALFNQVLLLMEQRGHENIFDASQNPFRDFLIDATNEFGWTIEDYMLEVLEGITPQWHEGVYDNGQQAENLVKDYEQKVRANWHGKQFSKQFATTIRDYEYKKMFYPSRFAPFIDRKIGMLNTSAEIYLMNSVLIDELKAMCTAGDMVVKNGYNINSSNGIKTLLETITGDYTAFSQPNKNYNKDGVISITPTDDLKYIVTKASYLTRIKTREYAVAFNLDQMKLEGRIIYVPEDYDMGQVDEEDVLFWLVDRRAIVIALKLWKMGSFYVANQYKTNHWLGVEGVRGHNTFINAVAYTGDAYSDFQ